MLQLTQKELDQLILLLEDPASADNAVRLHLLALARSAHWQLRQHSTSDRRAIEEAEKAGKVQLVGREAIITPAPKTTRHLSGDALLTLLGLG